MTFPSHLYPLNHLFTPLILVALGLSAVSCNKPSSSGEKSSGTQEGLFPEELVSFTPHEKNPVFSGTGADTWDQKIRERGYIIKEGATYHLWYTGFRENPGAEIMLPGYATSPDGIVWTRYEGNPIFTQNWVEDMMVIRHDSLYYMFAEGRNDIAHLLTSSDKIHWEDHGSLQIRQTNGEPLTPGPYGTPTVFIEGDVWHLFYERNDEGIWHATSTDLKVWKNIQDNPVIHKGPEAYDQYGVAVNQVIKHGDHYYAYYHGTPTEDWSEWNTNIAISQDLMTWEKYRHNPILEENKSSGILVNEGNHYRLYTMHERVHLHVPGRNSRR
jgi:predicted GH43/DUF377 family glycosyl hydrolase